VAWETIWQPREERYIHETAPTLTAGVVVNGTAPFESQFDVDPV
jgi:hypothetical protein